jgi:hypothetical protein
VDVERSQLSGSHGPVALQNVLRTLSSYATFEAHEELSRNRGGLDLVHRQFGPVHK